MMMVNFGSRKAHLFRSPLRASKRFAKRTNVKKLKCRGVDVRFLVTLYLQAG